jgi:hypothetical protein
MIFYLPAMHCQSQEGRSRTGAAIHLKTSEAAISRIVLVVLVAILAAELSEAQQQREWIPQGVSALRQSASSKTEFTLDHSMLVWASRLDQDNEDLRRVIAGVSGVSFHSYRFRGPRTYDPGTLSSVKQEYRATGWKQLVNNHAKGGGTGVTDLWIRFDNHAISNVAILLARSNESTLSWCLGPSVRSTFSILAGISVSLRSKAEYWCRIRSDARRRVHFTTRSTPLQSLNPHRRRWHFEGLPWRGNPPDRHGLMNDLGWVKT